MKIAILYGSSRPSKAGESVAKWFNNKVDFGDHDVELVDIAAQNLPLVPEMMPPMMVENSGYETEAIKAWAEKVSGYDAVVFVAAEYNMSVTPLLKNAVDVLFHEWSQKPVAFISYGAYPQSTSIEHLRTIMSPFKTKQVEATTHVSPAHEAISPEGDVDESKVTGDPQVVADALLAFINE